MWIHLYIFIVYSFSCCIFFLFLQMEDIYQYNTIIKENVVFLLVVDCKHTSLALLQSYRVPWKGLEQQSQVFCCNLKTVGSGIMSRSFLPSHASIFLLLKSFSKGRLWSIPLLDGGCYCHHLDLGFFFTALTMSSTAIVFLLWTDRCLVVSTPTVQQLLSFSVHSELSKLVSLFPLLQNGLLFSHRQLAGLHIGLYYFNKKCRAETYSRHSELFKQSMHTWPIRHMSYSHVPVFLVVRKWAGILMFILFGEEEERHTNKWRFFGNSNTFRESLGSPFMVWNYHIFNTQFLLFRYSVQWNYLER